MMTSGVSYTFPTFPPFHQLLLDFSQVFLEAVEPGGGRGYHTFLRVPLGDGWKLSASSFIITLRLITIRDSSQTPELPFTVSNPVPPTAP